MRRPHFLFEICSVCLVSCLFFLSGCQGQRPPAQRQEIPEPGTVHAFPPAHPSAAVSGPPRAASHAGDSGLQEAEDIDVVSTPFGLIRTKKSDTARSSLSGDVSQAPGELPVSQSASTRTDPQPEKRPEEGSRKVVAGTKAFVTHPVVKEDMTGPEATPGDITLNFDNADIREVIRAVADILKINYIEDPAVRGNVTIHTAGNIRVKDLFGLFMQILDAHGFTAVERGSVYHIIPLKDASRLPVIARFGREKAENLPPEERVVMQIVPLNHISGGEMSKLLAPFISAQGAIVTHEGSNILIIVDKGINMLKALRLVEAFDIDLFEHYTHSFLSVHHMDTEEASTLLKDVLSAYGKDEKKDFRLIPIKRLNRIIAVSSDADILNRLEKLLEEFDKPDDSVEPRLYVYFVKNGAAEDLGAILQEIFSTATATGTKTEPLQQPKREEVQAPKGPFSDQEAAKEPAAPGPAPSQGVPSQGSGTVRGTLKITTDKTRNALIIEAIPSDYRIVEEILTQLDVLPRQVLIEVVIAEISLDDRSEWGVEWDYLDGEGGITSRLLRAHTGQSGLQFTIGQTDRWSAALSALATKNKADILSAPLVLASDNKEARIDVSDQIPVASAEIVYTGDNPVTQTTIQYRNTGIILTVTPHINERGLVSMDISQEVSEEGAGKSVGGQDYPSFRQRKVVTSLTVEHGQTIVMGGLMREKEEKGKSGVPFLSNIPVLGWLFGKDTTDRTKVDLVLLITPRVIIDLTDVDEVTREFKDKVNSISSRYERAGHL
ncbi:MAG: type II secretion system secretin GspD [Desulfatiglandales bacterium]